MEKDKEHLKEELNQLRDVLKELHEQLKKQESINDNHGDSLQLKEDLVAKETSLFQAQSTIDQLRNQLEQTREEVSNHSYRKSFFFISMTISDEYATRNCSSRMY